MASSSNSSIENTEFETVMCRDCGRRALVLVSRSTKNPGRLYYGCRNHGWLKWVMTNTVFDEDKIDMGFRLPRGESRFGSEHTAYHGHNLGNWNVPRLVWILVIVNLTLLAVYLIGLLVYLVN